MNHSHIAVGELDRAGDYIGTNRELTTSVNSVRSTRRRVTSSQRPGWQGLTDGQACGKISEWPLVCGREV